MITHPDFFRAMAPYAQRVAQATGLRTGLFLSLMGEETGYGTSNLARLNNMSGIKFTGQPGTWNDGTGFAAYSSLDAWAVDMIRVIDLGYYDALRATAGQSIEVQIQALAHSPYNGYDGSTDRAADAERWAALLLSVYQEEGLAAYDGEAPSTPAPSQLPVVEPTTPPSAFNWPFPAPPMPVLVDGNVLSVQAPQPIMGSGPALVVGLLLAVAMWAAEHTV